MPSRFSFNFAPRKTGKRKEELRKSLPYSVWEPGCPRHVDQALRLGGGRPGPRAAGSMANRAPWAAHAGARLASALALRTADHRSTPLSRSVKDPLVPHHGCVVELDFRGQCLLRLPGYDADRRKCGRSPSRRSAFAGPREWRADERSASARAALQSPPTPRSAANRRTAAGPDHARSPRVKQEMLYPELTSPPAPNWSV